jgi:hypothetical protein
MFTKFSVSPEIARRKLHLVEDDYYAQLLGCALDGLDAHKGSITPAENFLMGTLISYALGKLTPAAVKRGLNEFVGDVETVGEEWGDVAMRKRPVCTGFIGSPGRVERSARARHRRS